MPEAYSRSRKHRGQKSATGRRKTRWQCLGEAGRDWMVVKFELLAKASRHCKTFPGSVRGGPVFRREMRALVVCSVRGRDAMTM